MNFEFVAVSDIWNRRREEGAAYIAEGLRTTPSTAVRNNDELYARKDIDAVLIATADFQHALHGVEAVNAGRDAYVEKPTAHTMEDARDFLDAVKKTGKIVAGRHAAPLHAQLSEGRRVHPVRQVRRHRHGRDELERQPARPLAPSRRRASAQRSRTPTGSAICLDRPARALRRAQVS